MSPLSFAGKVAIITGAGGALGKSYALDLAKRGCSLVVNDVGALVTGEANSNTGKLPSSAELLVQSIKSQGGKAILNTENVSNGSKIVEAALKEFGKCDILINNAGNLRDKSFTKLTHDDWKAVLDVHLNGTFQLCHAVWPIMQQQKFGRIVNIGSGAGLYGAFGQANYSSAKMGILGLTNTLAKEGVKHNIHVNCVVPVAASRMTQDLLPQEVLAIMTPDHVTPIVTYLVHDTTMSTGDCYEVGGGWYSKVRLQRSAGVYLGDAQSNAPTTAESIASHMKEISDFSHDVTYPTAAANAFEALMTARELKNSRATTTTTHSTSGTTSSSTTSSTSNTATAGRSIPFQSDSLFEKLQTFFVTNKDKALQLSSEVRANLIFDITDKQHPTEKHRWLVVTRDVEHPYVKALDATAVTGVDGMKTTTIAFDDATAIRLFTNDLSPEFAYMRGLITVDGNINAALRFKSIIAFAAQHIK